MSPSSRAIFRDAAEKGGVAQENCRPEAGRKGNPYDRIGSADLPVTIPAATATQIGVPMETRVASLARAPSAIRTIAAPSRFPTEPGSAAAAAGSTSARRRETPSAIRLGRTRTKGRAAAAAGCLPRRRTVSGRHTRRAGGPPLLHLTCRASRSLLQKALLGEVVRRDRIRGLPVHRDPRVQALKRRQVEGEEHRLQHASMAGTGQGYPSARWASARRSAEPPAYPSAPPARARRGSRPCRTPCRS